MHTGTVSLVGSGETWMNVPRQGVNNITTTHVKILLIFFSVPNRVPHTILPVYTKPTTKCTESMHFYDQ